MSAHLQQLVVDLWTDPATATTVAQAAQVYDERRRNLIAHLTQRGIDATGATGLNVWIPVPDETEAVTALFRSGWAVAPGARFRQSSPPAIRITVSALTPKSLPHLADAIAATLHVNSTPLYTT